MRAFFRRLAFSIVYSVVGVTAVVLGLLALFLPGGWPAIVEFFKATAEGLLVTMALVALACFGNGTWWVIGNDDDDDNGSPRRSRGSGINPATGLPLGRGGVDSGGNSNGSGPV